MLYNYKCNDCGHYYERSRPMVQRTDAGKCKKCDSTNTVKVMSTPRFKTCGGGHKGETK